MGKDGQAEARRFHGETQQDTGGAGYLFRTPGEMGEGVWSLDVVGLFKPQKHEKHIKKSEQPSNLCRLAKLCLTILTEMPGAGAIFSYLATVWIRVAIRRTVPGITVKRCHAGVMGSYAFPCCVGS
jgi:hypothetical protein